MLRRLPISDDFLTKPSVFSAILWIISSNPANRKEMLMRKIDRFRRPQQLQLFEPARCLPEWRNLPAETRRRLTELLARMFEEHVRVLEQDGTGGRDV